MSNIHILRDYPYPPAIVWRALTDPQLIPRWGVHRRWRSTRGLLHGARDEIPVRGQTDARLERHRERCRAGGPGAEPAALLVAGRRRRRGDRSDLHTPAVR